VEYSDRVRMCTALVPVLTLSLHDALPISVGLYYHDGGGKSIFWNREFKAFQQGFDKALPDSGNYITSLSHDARRYILNTVAPTQDRKSTRLNSSHVKNSYAVF